MRWTAYFHPRFKPEFDTLEVCRSERAARDVDFVAGVWACAGTVGGGYAEDTRHAQIDCHGRCHGGFAGEPRQSIEARGAELLARMKKRMTLRELRKGKKISQAQMAEALGIGQMQISRLEQRNDPRLSTMQRTVAAMGGRLTMIVTFPDQEPVILVTPAASEAVSGTKRSAAGSAKIDLRVSDRAGVRP